MNDYIANTKWSDVAMSTLQGAAGGVEWAFRLIILCSVLFLVTVHAGADPQQQLDIVTAGVNGGMIVLIGTAVVAALEEVVNQHDLKLNTEAEA